jgi:hypothetical protein
VTTDTPTAARTDTRRPATPLVAAAGYVLSWIVGLLLAPAAPGRNAPASQIAAFYADQGSGVLLSALLVHGTAGLALAVLAVAIARATEVRAGLRRVVVGTGLAAAALSLLQFGLAVTAVIGTNADTVSRTLRLSIDFVDVLKIALLAAFVWTATTAATRRGASPRWLQATAAVLVPLLLVGSSALVGAEALEPVLAASLLALLGWAAAIGHLVARGATQHAHRSPAA